MDKVHQSDLTNSISVLIRMDAMFEVLIKYRKVGGILKSKDLIIPLSDFSVSGLHSQLSPPPAV